MTKLGGNAARSASQHAQCVIGAGPMAASSILSRLWRDYTAITSLEFALVALPFFALILGTMAIGIWYFIQSSLDLAVYSTARLFQTGQIQTGVLANGTSVSVATPAQLSNILCSKGIMPLFAPCSATNPVLSVTIVDNYADLLQIGATQTNKNTGFTFNPIVVKKPATPTFCSPPNLATVYLEAVYKMPTLGIAISSFGGTIISGSVFQVEQFPSSNVTFNCPPPTNSGTALP
jgi:Flp pilus assembly protein TadG